MQKQSRRCNLQSETTDGRRPGAQTACSLHTEVSKCNEDLCAPTLTDLCNECLHAGSTPPLHKKQSSRCCSRSKTHETSASTDLSHTSARTTSYYKLLLAKVLAESFKRMMERFVSPHQTSFFSSGQVMDKARLCQLLQACLTSDGEKSERPY